MLLKKEEDDDIIKSYSKCLMLCFSQCSLYLNYREVFPEQTESHNIESLATVKQAATHAHILYC